MCADDIFAGLESVDLSAESSAAPVDFRAPFATCADAVRFMTAGNARVTVVSKATQTRFTFKVRAAKDNAELLFVSVLTGPDNWANYSYVGFIRRGVYFHGKAKARVGADAPSAKAFDWLWRAMARGELPVTCEVWHEGACGRCGRALTVPASIASGFGPECITRLAA